jgi:hypothetical protein
MMRVALVSLAVLVSGCGSSGRSSRPPGPPPASLPRMSDDAIIETMLARLGAAARCPGSRRVWCIPSGGWAQGDAAELPAEDRALVGVTIGLERERDDADLLATEVALSVLALRTSGSGRVALITDVPPENPSEKRVVRAAISSIGKVVKGEAERVELAPSLARHIETYVAQASYPLSRQGDAWTMVGKSNARLRKVGRVWVAIEVPRAGPEGIFVSLYPE